MIVLTHCINAGRFSGAAHEQSGNLAERRELFYLRVPVGRNRAGGRRRHGQHRECSEEEGVCDEGTGRHGGEVRGRPEDGL